MKNKNKLKIIFKKIESEGDMKDMFLEKVVCLCHKLVNKSCSQPQECLPDLEHSQSLDLFPLSAEKLCSAKTTTVSHK